jgi:DDE superfamily endonuclease
MTTYGIGNYVRNPLVAALFPPLDPAREATLALIHQAPPPETGRSRWTLALLQQRGTSLASLTTQSGVWQRLKRWRVRWKRGRLHVSSPDPLYALKMQALADALALATPHPDQISVLYADETTCHRQPFVGQSGHAQGRDGQHQPTADLAHAGNSVRRIVGTWDVVTGRLLYRAHSKMGVSQLVAFLKPGRKAYAPTRRIVLIWDNWPIHFYDNLQVQAQANQIELLNLPTYAPWTNPIEKLWRKLKQEVLCLHRLSQDWARLQEQVHDFLKG